MPVLLFLIILSLPIFFIFLLIRQNRSSENPRCRPPPGPRGLPFIGNLHQLDPSKIHLCFSQLSNRYGPIVYLKLGRVPAIVISSAQVAKQALKHNDLVFSGRPNSTSSKRLSYDHLDIVSSSYNEYWREMRKTVVLRLFTLKQVRSFRPVRENEVSRMICDITKMALDRSDRVVDLSERVMCYSINLLCRVAFGKRYGEKHFDMLYVLVLELQKSTMDMFLADYFPPLGWIDKFSGVISRLDKVFKNMDSFFQQLIDEHLSSNMPNEMEGDILDLLIQLREDTSASVKIDWNNIKAILMNIFVGGTDTSAATIVWALTALMKNPSVMKKAQQEIRSHIGNKKSSVDEDDIENLPFLRAVIKETMRLYPPLPLLIPKETMEKCTINGYEIEPKTITFVNVWDIGRDPEYWENPNEFLPDRFLNSGKNIDFKGQDFGFIPFGSGRRSCPGLSLGVAAVEMALANLLYSFDLELPRGMNEGDIDTDGSQGLTVHKKNPLCVIVKRHV